MTETQVAEWLDAYRRAWEDRDADAAAVLFTQDTTYRSHIFSPPDVGRDGVRRYWEEVTRTQRDVAVVMAQPVIGRETVAAEWWTTMSTDEGADITLVGILLLSFADDGRCRALREYWASDSGRTEPPGHWGEVDVDGPDSARDLSARWAEKYAAAWRELDVDRVVELFSPDVVYASHPLREPARGHAGVRSYTQAAFVAEAGGDVDVRFSVLASAGRTGVVEYWACVEEEGRPSTIAGCDVLLFDDEGRCVLLREYWQSAEACQDPPAEWGG